MHGKLCLSFESCKTLWLKALFVKRMVSSHTLCTIDNQISLFIKSEVFFMCHEGLQKQQHANVTSSVVWQQAWWKSGIGSDHSSVDSHALGCLKTDVAFWSIKLLTWHAMYHCFSHFDCVCKAHCNIIWQIVIELWVRFRNSTYGSLKSWHAT